MKTRKKKISWIKAMIGLLICGEMLFPAAGNTLAATTGAGHVIKITHHLECPICGMYIEQHRHTAFELFTRDGKRLVYCGVACGLRDINNHGGLGYVKRGYATDWVTRKAVDFRQATYVIGSDIIPDMIPNIIAFASAADAQAFVKKHGGRIESLQSLLAIISPVGMTVPFRIPPAATPPKGIFVTGVGFKMIRKDNLLSGSDDISYAEAFETKPMRPKKMEAKVTFLKMLYALTDNVTLTAVIPRLEKKLTIRKKGGAEISESRSGLGDINVNLRWRLYHDDYFDKHFGLYFGATLPTGDYDKDVPTALQLGKGSVSLTGGPLWSQHIGKFWFHASLLYTYSFENSDDFQYGDSLNGGVALHFTPTPDNMVGLEVDGSISGRSQLNDVDVYDSGGKHVYASLVTHHRIALFWGGNLSLRGMFGVPLYEDVNGVQLGEKYHWVIALTYKKQF